MAEFMIIYGAGKPPASKEAGAAHMAAWQSWVAGLGDAIVNPGTPLMNGKMVGNSGVRDIDPAQKISGYAVINAEDLDAAIEIAKTDPFLKMGDVQVAQVMKM